MKIICQNLDVEKDMQDLVNLFYDEEDCPFSLEHKAVENGLDIESKLYVLAGDKQDEYVCKFSLPQDAISNSVAMYAIRFISLLV